MYLSSQVSNGACSSLAKGGGSENDDFNFQQHEQHVVDDSFLCFNFPEASASQNLQCQCSGDNSSTPLFRSFVDSLLSSHEDTFCQTYSEHTSLDLSLYENLGHVHNRLMGDDSAPVTQRGNCTSGKVPTRQKRIKWTKDLHEQFVAAVNILGGPQEAKPKAVLQLMNSTSLTIFHVKSHLQVTLFNIITSYKQIDESRQLQLEVRRSIEEQLEIQRNLLMQVEQQKKQLQNV
ncbi:protein PHR1-LIKE 1-like [Abrus precatorius]|uniref:Protein PHR1-LIKE 1-like n=1 Tax=Abrus precatorius TaxID=3816 RepID=A0A8B8M6K0_ABRPR|nr:protein PHR1-LIKE 1-like [Abrus precatorius]